jgi:hypothetical protein
MRDTDDEWFMVKELIKARRRGTLLSFKTLLERLHRGVIRSNGSMLRLILVILRTTQLVLQSW